MGQESGEREPGNFGLDPLNILGNPEKRAKYELQEIKNGRLAMWAAAGMIMQGLTTDGGALDNLMVRRTCPPPRLRGGGGGWCHLSSVIDVFDERCVQDMQLLSQRTL